VAFGIARVPHDRIDVTAGTEVVCIFVNGRELAEAVEQGSRAHRSGRDAASLFGPPPAAWVPYELDLLAEDPGAAPEALGGARRELGPFRFDREAYETALRAPAVLPWPYARDGAAG
jgi:hypothetical protein